jgi:hypothetical protein
MKIYTPQTPPKSGMAKKLWKLFDLHGIFCKTLHYNPNCWGPERIRNGNLWGRWIVDCNFGIYICFIHEGNLCLGQTHAPYEQRILETPALNK